MVLVWRLQVDEGLSRLGTPVFRRRAFGHPAQRLLVVTMTALIAMDVDPRLALKFPEDPVHAAGMQHHRRVPALAEHRAADALPFVRALAAVIAVAGQDPQHVVPLPARD